MGMGGDKLRSLCIGHPAATIAWPHRELHEAADMMDRIVRALREVQEHGYSENVMHAHSRWSIPGHAWLELMLIYQDLINASAALSNSERTERMSSAKRKDTRKGDRHRPGYWVDYGRKRRARDKELRLQATKPAPSPAKTE